MMARDELAWICEDIRISLISVVADSNQRMSCFPRWGWGRPHPHRLEQSVRPDLQRTRAGGTAKDCHSPNCAAQEQAGDD